MKKATFIVLALLFATTTIMSQQSYPIWILGIQVTDSNASNITGPNISGSVKYIDSTKTLMLTGATIGDSNQH